MKVAEFFREDWGQVFRRISKGFHDYAPNWVQWVENPEDSDVYMVHIIGKHQVPELERKVRNRVIIQQCYFSANHKLVDYPSYWKKAALTISFHNLPDYTNEKFNFYRMPWGADKRIFRRTNWSEPRDIKLFTTGYVVNSESLDTVFNATKSVGRIMFHTGRDFEWDNRHYRYLEHMTDEELVAVLNRTQYIACLRKVEGFELLGIEGLFCGARPIVFDLPTYDAYGDHAYTVNPKQDVAKQLVGILSKEPSYVDREEYRKIVETFCWDNLVPRMFERIRNSL